MKRRELIKGMGAAGIATTLPLATLTGAAGGKSMNVLFMGGTGFIGPHMVRAILAQGHNVTLCNRGKSNPGLFKDLELIKADRTTDAIKQVAGRKWDYVVDTSAYIPRAVNMLTDALDLEYVQHYVFISTLSVYADYSVHGLHEDSALATMDDPTSEEVGKYYGALKALCEQAVEKALPGKVTKVRCGMIIGPGDSTDRFTYWPERVHHGGEVLAPGNPGDPFQSIDVRDLANWVTHCLDKKVVGAYNAVHAPGTYSFGEMLELCREKLNPDARLIWVAHKFLEEQGLNMGDLPFWITPDGPFAGLWSAKNDRATAAGLTHRPLAETIADTHEWFQSLPRERQDTRKAGMSLEKEAGVLAAWHKSQQSG